MPDDEIPSEFDRRWVLIQRPLVVVGGELTLENADLTWSEAAKFYEAPFQMKSNGGTLVIDDFGRQRVAPQDLLNRWIVPLERRVDYLALHTGNKIEVTGTLDSQADAQRGSSTTTADSSAPGGDAPRLIVESGKVIAPTCTD